MQRYTQSGERGQALREPRHDRFAPRPAASARSNDPIEMAEAMLNGPQRKALMDAIAAHVKSNLDERRHFSAAVGRVYKLTGEDALTQAVRNYLSDLSRPSDTDRAVTLEWLTKTVSSLSGIPLFGLAAPGSAAAQREAEAAPLDPRAAAEALFRPRTDA